MWYVTNEIIFRTGLFPFSSIKCMILRCFGSRLGKKVRIKPHVNIKFPWLLEIGDYCWIGEDVWIDNLAKVNIGNNVCISQGAMLLTANHDYRKETFDIFVKPIIIEDGVWIGAKSVICPGVTCYSHAVLTVGSIATSNLEPFGIYKGNPAIKVKNRL
jgi:putative colanic acid biosynthesis acetyltransferase WcaF